MKRPYRIEAACVLLAAALCSAGCKTERSRGAPIGDGGSEAPAVSVKTEAVSADRGAAHAAAHRAACAVIARPISRRTPAAACSRQRSSAAPR